MNTNTAKKGWIKINIKVHLLLHSFILIFSINLYAETNPKNIWRHKEQLCHSIYIFSDTKINFTANEKKLICGDENDPAYSKIPPYQSEFLLKSILESKAYLNPRFSGNLDVSVGEQNILKKITMTPQHPKIEKKLQNFYKNLPLTPSLLNALEDAALKEFKTLGSPCIKISTQANRELSTVELQIKNIVTTPFGLIKREDLSELESTALARFYPFKPEDIYNEEKLILAEKRLNSSRVVQGSYFQEDCAKADKINITHQFLLGPPRTFRFGVGISTEKGPLIRVRWSHHRFRKMASQFDISLMGSLTEQGLRLSTQYFFWKNAPRRSILTSANLTRDNPSSFTELKLELPIHLQWSRDWFHHNITWSIGPSLKTGEFIQRINNEKNKYANASLEAQTQWMSHSYEIYSHHPEEGRIFELKLDYRAPSLGFTENLLYTELIHKEIFRLLPLGRGFGILGLRLSFGNTWVKDSINLLDLPPSLKHYAGGSDELRGFPPASLPENNGTGAPTKLVQGMEFRKTHLFWSTLEGLVFIDSAVFGSHSWRLNSPLYWSSGVGFRFLSPIGMLQTFSAWRFKEAPHESLGPYFFIGLGGEF